MEYKRKKVGLITFGLCLISAGVVSLLNQFYDAPLFNDYFMLWPIFLIILGLEFIFTKLYYDFKKIDVELSPSIASIFLIILILFAGLAWEGFNRLPIKENWNWNGININNGQKYEYEVTCDYESGPINVSSANAITINNIMGSIDVQASTGDTLEIKAKISGTANDKKKAESILQGIIHISPGSTTTVEVEAPSQSEQVSVYNVDFVVHIPATLAVKADTQFGDVRIVGIENDVEINNRHGEVHVEGIGGSVNIQNEFDNTNVVDVKQDLSISSRHGQVNIEKIGGNVKIQNEFNSTNVADVKKDLSISSRHGKVQADNIYGNVSIKNEHNSTYCSNVKGNISVYSKHGSVNLESIAGNIDIDNEYDPITLTNPSYENADIKAVADYSNIIVQGLKDFAVNTDGNHREGKGFYGDGSQKIDLKSKHGNITIKANK